MTKQVTPSWSRLKGEYVIVCPSCKVEWTDDPGYIDEIKMIKTSNKCPACPKLNKHTKTELTILAKRGLEGAAAGKALRFNLLRSHQQEKIK